MPGRRLQWWWVPVPAILIAASVPFWPEPGDRSGASQDAGGEGEEADGEYYDDEAEAGAEGSATPGAPARRRRKGAKRPKSDRRERGGDRREADRRDAREPKERDTPNKRDAGTDRDDRRPAVDLGIIGKVDTSVDNGDGVDAALSRLRRSQGSGEGGLSTRSAVESESYGVAAVTSGSGGSRSGSTELGERGETAVGAGRKGASQGRIPQDVARRVLDQAQREAQYCYEKEIEFNPDLRGRVSVDFVVDSSGSVSTAVLTKTTLAHPPTESCILKMVKRLRFPGEAGRAPAPMTYDWRFGGGL